MNKLMMEEYAIKLACEPVDMNTAAITGARIGMAQGEKVAIVISMGDSTAAVADFTLKQHTLASGGTTKDLSIANKYFKKVGAATKFTKVEPTVAAANYVLSTDFAADPGVVVFEVYAEDLDVNGGFNFLSINVADSTAAKIINIEYVLRGVKYAPAYLLDV